MKEKKGSPCPSLSLLLYKLLQRACAHTQLNKLFASSATSMYKTLEEKKATREKKRIVALRSPHLPQLV